MRYLILGATEARDAQGDPLPLGGARLRALLTALALRAARPAPTPVPVLIDEVWTDDPPHDAIAALQALVGRLRRVIGREAVVSAPGGYRLAADRDDIDLFHFERLADEGGRALEAGDPGTAAATLRTALALWRGPALADLPDGAAAAARPEALRLTALHQRVEADLVLGRAAEVLPELRGLVADHPLDEPFHAQLIRALWATGRAADALAAYEDVRHGLAERLGTEPGAGLQALHRRLLNGDPSTDTVPGPPRPVAAPPPRPGTAATGGGAAPGGTPAPESTSAPHGMPAPGTEHAPYAAPALHAAGAPRPATGDSASAAATSSGPPHGGAAPVQPASHAPRGNLRARLTSFVGRQTEVAALGEGLCEARLITLTGPGGSGKTRLSEETAATVSGAYPDGVWVAELAPLDDPLAVPGTVLSAVGRRETVLLGSGLEGRNSGPEHADPTARLIEHCASRRLLLLLDNCEHLIDAAARLAETLLAHCPGVTVLATSREPLGDRFRLLTSGSRTVLPRQQTLRAVVDWSWDLLDERERTVLRRAAVFTGGWDLAAAEAVCAGRPPAPGDEPTAHLDPRPLRSVQAQPAVPAQRTAAAAPVPIDVPEVLDLLGALVDKSLLVAEHPQPPAGGEAADRGPGEVRYRMLETIHEYATERAEENAATRRDQAAAVRRHLAHFQEFTHTAEPRLRSAEQLPWLHRVETELDNIRAALHRSLQAGDTVSARAIVFDLGWFWFLRNYRDEGSAWVTRLLGLLGTDLPERDTPDGDVRWDVVDLRLLDYFLVADRSTGAELTRPENVELARRICDAYAARVPGPRAARFPGILWPFGRYLLDGLLGVLMLFDDAIENCRRYGEEWALGAALMFRTHLAIDTPGGMAWAEAHWGELRGLSRRVGDRWMLAQVAGANGELAMAHGRYEEARASYEEALRLARELRAYTETPFLITRLADLAVHRRQPETALRLLDRADEEAQRYGVRDATAFNRVLRAHIELRAGNLSTARVLCDEARELARTASPPPQFWVAVDSLNARVEAETGELPAALRRTRDTLALGLESNCAETLLAQQALSTAVILRMCGEDRRAALLLGAAVGWQAGLPWTPMLAAEVAGIEEEARAALGQDVFAAQHAAGIRLTGPECLAQLDEALARLSPGDAPRDVVQPGTPTPGGVRSRQAGSARQGP
ncbi:hypothetical protein ACZ90_50860 [Streptomyces albus subsp. albus]|nr:hypothetical protein ACZ90_50860 [Streptomyces albus subsp. albus]